MNLRKNAFMASLTALLLFAAVAHAASPGPSSPAPDVEAIAQTNELIGNFNAQLDARAEIMKDIPKETPEQIIETMNSAKTDSDLKAAANKFWAMKAKELEDSSSSTRLVGQPMLTVTPVTTCVHGYQMTYGANARWDYLAACNQPQSGLRMSVKYQLTPLEGSGAVTRLNTEGSGNYTGRNFEMQIIDHKDFDTRYRYAYTATVTTQVLAPQPAPKDVAYLIANKLGFGYPTVYDITTGRYVWFPTAPFNPARTPNYDLFGRRCQEYYNSRGWTWPISSHQNHHVKPARWGGEDVGSNCMRLPNSTHSTFTTWWGVGNLNFETPVSH